MKYTGPKFKLCRREWINLFWVSKYDVRKRRWTPWQHWANMARLSEYGKLLRNKQSLKRMYLLTEKQFRKLVIDDAWKFSKNKWINHDQAVIQFLERRLDSTLVKAGFAQTIMQARQMICHGHFKLNWSKHNVSSYYMKSWDKLELRDRLKSSSLYTDIPALSWKFVEPSWLKVDKSKFSIEMLDLPHTQDITLPVDVLKVIEYYARA